LDAATHLEFRHGEFLISTDPARLDVEAIHAFLSRTDWAKGVAREVVERSLRYSLCFGMYHQGRQIGLARVITDRATFGYLADVYVLEPYRGRGLGKWLVRCVLAHPELQGLRSLRLATRDAHGLYRQFGFTALKHPEHHLERRPPGWKDENDKEDEDDSRIRRHAARGATDDENGTSTPLRSGAGNSFRTTRRPTRTAE
jgi:GNAT superfamily N-acetyltransferase